MCNYMHMKFKKDEYGNLYFAVRGCIVGVVNFQSSDIDVNVYKQPSDRYATLLIKITQNVTAPSFICLQ